MRGHRFGRVAQPLRLNFRVADTFQASGSILRSSA
jgi:hypothetical protein